jgi:hypothetical protein
MTDQSTLSKQNHPRTRVVNQGASMPIYGMGLIGALVYYIQHAATLGMGLLGVLKAIVWPAMVIYKMLELLKL